MTRRIGWRGHEDPRRRAEEFGQPLVVQEVDLAEPKAGEALVRLAACGVCHTDLYTASGADPTGYAPCVLGHEGAGVVEAVGAGVTLVAPGDHVITLFAPECGKCVHCLQPAHEPLRRDPRPAEPRLPARRHDAPLPRRRAAAPLHGHLDVRRVHGDAGDRAREGRPGGAARGLRAVRLRPLDRDRRGAEHGPGRAGLDRGRLRLRARRPRRRDRRAARRRRADRRVRPLGGAARAGAPPRRDRHARRRPTTRSTGSAARPAASAPTTPSRRPGTSPSCARRSRRRARPGGSRRCAASPARARCSRSSRAC